MTSENPPFTADMQQRPFWWEAAPPYPATAALPDATEVAIIGGGIAGLATALELGRQGVKALVLDREAIGWGASSRNGGALSGAGSLGKVRSDLAEVFGKAFLAELAEEGEAAFERFEALVAREELDCDYIRCGRFVGAHAPKAMEGLKRRAEMINEAGGTEQAFLLPRGRVREEIATDRYQGGMVLLRAGALHPAKYVRSLARAAERQGARLAGGVELLGYRRELDGGFVLQTSAGTLRARHLMLATNGYTGPATPWQRRRLVPVASFMIATEEIGEERVRAALPRLRVYGDTKKILYYFRPSPDHRRILFGGRASFVDGDVTRAGRTLHRFMVDLIPDLAAVRVTHCWKGNVAFAFDMMPHVGIQDGVHYALACNGSGVVGMTHFGTVAAQQILGGSNRVSAFARIPFPTRPFYTGNPWFMPAIGMAYQLRDRLDGWHVKQGGKT
ncbi:NAD(P)/FAD-dependent oxidoreductase [Falsiroseomonas selenitidurans]|uniref:FAD-binding oxidoreductase n=1 Tax=Falsiroseomonas selenitidurans TaxID=2716335 RepID=A0ABX1DZC0_9PROT|nr:FAD-dependent oxidoreductase [Falsiroseomonas selenitidurans]NKC30234.1 FAD-binding oxidoreductase [Falsiroseomonas selenitidurans]